MLCSRARRFYLRERPASDVIPDPNDAAAFTILFKFSSSCVQGRVHGGGVGRDGRVVVSYHRPGIARFEEILHEKSILFFEFQKLRQRGRRRQTLFQCADVLPSLKIIFQFDCFTKNLRIFPPGHGASIRLADESVVVGESFSLAENPARTDVAGKGRRIFEQIDDRKHLVIHLDDLLSSGDVRQQRLRRKVEQLVAESTTIVVAEHDTFAGDDGVRRWRRHRWRR